MTLQILAFGIIKEIFGGPSVELELAPGSTAADLRTVLEQRYPRLQQLASCLLAVNNEYASADQPVGEGDEIAVIPPVSGG